MMTPHSDSHNHCKFNVSIHCDNKGGEMMGAWKWGGEMGGGEFTMKMNNTQHLKYFVTKFVKKANRNYQNVTHFVYFSVTQEKQIPSESNSVETFEQA